MPKVSPITAARDSSTILIVDDEDNILDLLRFNLERLGMETVTARNETGALDVVETRSSDLVVLDIMMPKMDGFQVHRYIRKHSNQKTADPVPHRPLQRRGLFSGTGCRS